MTLDLVTIGYLSAAAAYATLLIVLLIGWRGQGSSGAILITVALLSILWAAIAAWQSGHPGVTPGAVVAAELLRDTAWVVFVWRILRRGGTETIAVPRALDVVAMAAGLAAIASLALLLASEQFPLPFEVTRFVLFTKLGMVLAVLVLVEHLYRCTVPKRRWAIKHLCIALAGVYCFDFYNFAEALLFYDLNSILPDARGYVHAVVAPLIAVSASRNPQWQLEVFVSRQVVFHSGVMIVAGIYLVIVASAGYYLKRFGGDWGQLSQVVLVFTAVIVLTIVIASSDVRARLKVFINKHFFRNRFDHREEWQRITQTLIGDGLGTEALPQRSIRAIADIVGSPGGLLWLKRSDGRYETVARWHVADLPRFSAQEEVDLVAYLARKGWIVELQEYRDEPGRYEGLKLPQALLGVDWVWLIVPLIQARELVGIVFLMEPQIRHEMNWEVRDLLKVAAHHVASYLQLEDSLRALTEARQFEGFNRLSAYVIHDLKNLIAQLSLVVTNTKRHGDNPEFLRDAIGTVDNAVARMNRLMQQLRSGDVPRPAEELIDLDELTAQAVERRGAASPPPLLEKAGEALPVKGDKERMLAVIGNFIQNAQEATPADGEVRVRVWRESDHGNIEISDTGSGMSEAFVLEHLFRPFDSTKGLTGMGIGAYEGREFFRGLGGDVTVWSEPGCGTRLRAVVPIVNISNTEKQAQ